jgi:ATP-dependent DNA ligase
VKTAEKDSGQNKKLNKAEESSEYDDGEEEEEEDEEEEEKKQGGAKRKSKRNVGKKPTYDIDKYLDEIDKQACGTSGGGGIQVMLAQNYDPEKTDPAGWLMSEKLDGVRCYWDGKAMYTRNGHLFYPPDFFKKELPNMALDGELWTGRDDFQKIVSIVRRQDKNSEWSKIKYMVFDAPKLKIPFKNRLEKLEQTLSKCDANVVMLHPHSVCDSREHLI